MKQPGYDKTYFIWSIFQRIFSNMISIPEIRLCNSEMTFKLSIDAPYLMPKDPLGDDVDFYIRNRDSQHNNDYNCLTLMFSNGRNCLPSCDDIKDWIAEYDALFKKNLDNPSLDYHIIRLMWAQIFDEIFYYSHEFYLSDENLWEMLELRRMGKFNKLKIIFFDFLSRLRNIRRSTLLNCIALGIVRKVFDLWDFLDTKEYRVSEFRPNESMLRMYNNFVNDGLPLLISGSNIIIALRRRNDLNEQINAIGARVKNTCDIDRMNNDDIAFIHIIKKRPQIKQRLSPACPHSNKCGYWPYIGTCLGNCEMRPYLCEYFLLQNGESWFNFDILRKREQYYKENA